MSLLAENIKYLMSSKKITSVELAKRAKLSRNYVYQISVGKQNPSPEVLERIAKALSIEPDTLVSKRLDTVQDLSMVSFGERLKRLRVAKGYTKTKLSKIASVDRLIIAKAENNGRVNDVTISKLAKALGVSIEVLLGEEHSRATPTTFTNAAIRDITEFLLAHSDKMLAERLAFYMKINPSHLIELLSSAEWLLVPSVDEFQKSTRNLKLKK